MSERDPESERASDPDLQTDDSTASRRSSMRARRWVIAHRYRDPEAYGIPDLPAWDVRTEDGRLAFAASAETEPFIRAERPMRVRR